MDISTLFDFGKHTPYVLSAWGVTILILSGIAVQSYSSWKKSEKKRQELEAQK